MYLTTTCIETPLGTLRAIAGDSAIIFLGFADNPKTPVRMHALLAIIGSELNEGKNEPLMSIEYELAQYFTHQLTVFKTLVRFHGTPFQKTVWQALSQIPYGVTRSYKEQAYLIGKPSASRSVGTAYDVNNLPIIIPCHRVISNTGGLGGYNGGLERKKWLLAHEGIQF